MCESVTCLIVITHPAEIVFYPLVGSTRGSKTPVPSETKSQPSLDTKGLSSSPRSSPSELRKTKPKDDKLSSKR